MSSNGTRENQTPNRPIGHRPRGDDIIGDILRAIGSEAAGMPDTSSTINTSNSVPVDPTSNLQDPEILEQAPRDSGLQTSSSDLTTLPDPTFFEGNSTFHEIAQDAELIARRALEASGYVGLHGNGSPVQPDQTCLSGDRRDSNLDTVGHRGGRADSRGPRSLYPEVGVSGYDDRGVNPSGGPDMAQRGLHNMGSDHEVVPSDVSIMESNRQHLLGLLDPRNSFHDAAASDHLHPGSSGRSGRNGTTETLGLYGSGNGTTQTSGRDGSGSGTTNRPGFYGFGSGTTHTPSIHGSGTGPNCTSGLYGRTTSATSNTSGTYGSGTSGTTNTPRSYGSNGMMPAASYTGHRLDYQAPPSYHFVSDPVDLSAIDPGLALVAAYNRSNNPDEDYSHLYVDIPAPEGSALNNTFMNNQEDEQPQRLAPTSNSISNSTSTSTSNSNSRSQARPRATRRKRKTASDDNSEAQQQDTHPTPAPRSRARARPSAPDSTAAASSSARPRARAPRSSAASTSTPMVFNASNDPILNNVGYTNANGGSAPVSAPAYAPAPAPAVPAPAPNGAPSLTASLNDSDIPSTHRRRQPSVVDAMDPYTCHLCYHTCLRASTIREHYLQKHPELRLTKNNLHEYEPARLANIRPLSYYRGLGLDTTYTGVDRKQVNARRRMDLGLRTTDPNYLRDVYKDTTSERTRAQRLAAKEDGEDKRKRRKKNEKKEEKE
ncbi:hypothetical protein PV08_03896 [Exophiala spinifera]|uniref:C2H2-type domain-containing protein n=1 Tax=Exophiala spinifera TaxID=91928 RepID=A0A0D1ZVF9_9EURO|nr:uncharacterized protein PV08_03896 [Exophiala spinifera]KIW16707.1 hypothetical protein PV08_03896 [Exophiala spinifera]